MEYDSAASSSRSGSVDLSALLYASAGTTSSFSGSDNGGGLYTGLAALPRYPATASSSAASPETTASRRGSVANHRLVVGAYANPAASTEDRAALHRRHNAGRWSSAVDAAHRTSSFRLDGTRVAPGRIGGSHPPTRRSGRAPARTLSAKACRWSAGGAIEGAPYGSRAERYTFCMRDDAAAKLWTAWQETRRCVTAQPPPPQPPPQQPTLTDGRPSPVAPGPSLGLPFSL